KDHTAFAGSGQAVTDINAVSGLHASGTLAVNAGGFFDLVGTIDSSIDTAAATFSLTVTSPALFVGTGGAVDTSNSDPTQWSVTNGTGFAVASADAGAGSITVLGAAGEFGLEASNLKVGLVGLGSVATFTVGNFNAVYNKDHTAFAGSGQAVTDINAVSGLHASGTLAVDAGGFFDLVGTIDSSIDTAAATFSLTVTSPALFVGTGGAVDTSNSDPTQWSVTNGTGFAVASADAGAGSITVLGAAGEFGLEASNLKVGLVGLGSVATFTVGNFNAVYNKDHTAFAGSGQAVTDINAVSGLHASGTLAVDAGGFFDLVGTIDSSIDTAAATFSLTVTSPALFVGTGGAVDTSNSDPTQWSVTNGTGFAVASADAGAGSITVLGAAGEFGLEASNLKVGLVGLGSVATFTVGNFNAVYNKDHTAFAGSGQAVTDINAVSGLHASGTLAVDAGGFFDLVGTIDSSIDTAAATFSLTVTSPALFVGTGGAVDTSNSDPTQWSVTNGTGFAVASADAGAGSITVLGAAGEFGLEASNLKVGLVGLGSVATFTVGNFNAVYNKDHTAFAGSGQAVTD